MTTPLPQPDARYLADIDAAWHARGRTILDALRPYCAEPDMVAARDQFNRDCADVVPAFTRAIEAAQAALRTRATPVCATCHTPMTIIEPGQRTHPMCDPPAPDGAPDVEEDW